MKKRVFAVMLALSLSMTSILVPVSAVELSPDATTINEYDYVMALEDVTRYDLTCKIDYYVGPQKFYEGTGTEEPNLDFNVVNMQFNVLKSLGDQTYAYAKHGEVKVKVKVEEESDAIINYIKIAGLYGHTLIGAGSPTVAVGPGVGNISISLTGNTSVDNIGGRKAKIGAGNTFEYIQ